MTHSSITDEISYSNNSVVGTTTTTPTPTTTSTTTTPAGGSALPAGGADCDSPTTWPSSDNTKYQVTFTDNTTEWTYYYSGVDTKKLYMSVVGDPTTPVGGRVRVGRATDGTPPCFFDVYNNAAAASLLAGFDMSAASSGKFSIRAWDGATVSTWDIWIDN